MYVLCNPVGLSALGFDDITILVWMQVKLWCLGSNHWAC